MEIRSIEQRPSTINAWGFGGTTDRRAITMTNGDVWLTGTAHYRHMCSVKYIRCHALNIDHVLRGTAEAWLAKFYGRRAAATL